MIERNAGETNAPARVLVVDDHEIARSGLIAFLAREPGYDVVGEATSGGEALQAARRLRPDLVLMDVRMPEMDGLHATQLLKQELPETIVVMVTMHENPEYLLEALRVGAAGYLLKETGRREFLAALRRVLNGEYLLDQQLSVQLLRRLAAEQRAPAPATLPAPLSQREQEVLHLIVAGKTNKEIARALSVSVATVKTHVGHVIAKLGVSDRTQAAVRAVQAGYVAVEPDVG